MRKNEVVIYDNKQRALANADELLITARNWVGEKNEHLREDDIAEFARGNISFRTPDVKCYDADVLVATKKTGAMLLYDIINLREIKITEAPTADLSKNSRRISETSVTDESVTQDLTDVNTKFQLKQKDADYTDLSKLDSDSLKVYNDKGWARSLLIKQDNALLNRRLGEIFHENSKYVRTTLADGTVVLDLNN